MVRRVGIKARNRLSLIELSAKLADEVNSLSFSEPVHTVYNPLIYARDIHNAYLSTFGEGTKEVVFVGMNPGPYGMAQTGVPFGEISAVRDWMGLRGKLSLPNVVHPKRPIQGLECPRREVSGARLWGWAQDHFKNPQSFFKRFFVTNYCPLVFMEEGGKNRTPDKMPKRERDRLYAICDQSLRDRISLLKPKWVIGVGAFAEARITQALGNADYSVGRILHPSPASPIANRGWAPQASAALQKLGIQF